LFSSEKTEVTLFTENAEKQATPSKTLTQLYSPPLPFKNSRYNKIEKRGVLRFE
jgi:hypothetical protein